MKTVILIPYGRQNEERERNLRAVFRWYGPLGQDWSVTLGTSDQDKPFNRAQARNNAAKGAGDWDVALINDADCLAEVSVVEAAVALAVKTGKMVLPHDDFWRFTPRGTPILIDDLEFYRDHPQKAKRLSDRMTVINKNVMPSGAVVVTREAFTRIGGYDERFTGWGYEDSVFLKDAQTSIGTERLPGRLWHLWHPRDTGTMVQRERDREVARVHREAYTR